MFLRTIQLLPYLGRKTKRKKQITKTIPNISAIIKEDRRDDMENDEYYNLADDVEMQKKHLYAQRLCHEHNLLDPKEFEKRQKIIRKLFADIGENFTIEQPFHCDYGYFITIGKNFYANYNLTILDTAKVTIGDNVFLGPNVNLYPATHPLDVERRNKNLEKGVPVTIGDNVWIDGNTTILPGVSIGNNTVIGAGSVVTKNIPSNVLAVGNPCKVIKNL